MAPDIRQSNTRGPRARVAVVVPCYKVTEHIEGVLAAIGPEVAVIIAVDDACPDNSGALIRQNVSDPRVEVINLEQNRGVGGAVIAGLLAAKAHKADIAVKVDGDGQMDPSLIPNFIRPIIQGHADYTKGNRFYNPRDLRRMPKGRLIGNAVLSFAAKFSTGYWNIFDPTNGYVALELSLLDHMDLDRIAQRYFFESDLLFRVGLARAKVLDIPMTAIYADETSHLRVRDEGWRFFKGHVRNFIKRIWYSYFLRDFNIASLELLVGLATLMFGVIYGLIKMGGDEAAPAGVVMLAAFPALTGIMLLLSFLNYDIRNTPTDPIWLRLTHKTTAPRPEMR